MSDMFESPIIMFESRSHRRSAVVYLGHKMFHSTAARMAEYRGDLRRMSNEGLSIAKAAKKLGFVEDTVRRWARIFKITFKKASNRTFKHYDKQGWDDVVRAGAVKGYSYSQIALQLNVPVINVYRHAKKMGLNWKELKKQHAKKN